LGRGEPITGERDDRFMRTLALWLVLASNEPPEVADLEPPRGRVALGLGIPSTVVGVPLVLTGAVFLTAGHTPDSFGGGLLGAGVAAVSLGTVSVIVGAHRNGKWNAWAARNPGRVSRLSLGPTGWAGRESFGFAIVGRF
jgi:hypothetical protein